MWKWLEGKKTWLSALALAGGAAVLRYMGLISTGELAIALGAAGGFVGLADKFNPERAARFFEDVLLRMEERRREEAGKKTPGG